MELQPSTCTDSVVVVLSAKGSSTEQMAGTASAAAMPPPPNNEDGKAALAQTPASQSTSIKSPSSSVPDSVRDVLKLSFPRCSICKTSWYDALAPGNDDGESKPAAGKRRRHRVRPSHRNLYPMPKCGCATRLALPALPSAVSSGEECKDPQRALSRVQTHSFPNLAMCRSCLEQRIAASKQVTVHDYRMEHVPNGQRNVKFTVEADCVQCKRKFMGRVLEKLLDGGGGPGNNTSNASGRKKKGKPEANWWDAVEATIQYVGWAKRESRRERRRILRQRRDEKMNQSGEAGRSESTNTWWETHKENMGGGGDCSSDECYSLSSDSCDEWHSDDDSRRTKGARRAALKPGELMADLLRRDPKFRQEREDEQYVKKVVEVMEKKMEKEQENKLRQERDDELLMKKFMEEEEAKQKAAAARAHKDHELAMKLQEEYDKNQSKVESKESPILSAFKKASARNTDGKQSPSGGDAARNKHGNQRRGPDGRSASSAPSLSVRLSSESVSISSSKNPAPTNSAGIDIAESQSSSHSRTSNKATSIAASAVSEIVAMGFPEASARRRLKDANGDIELAVSMLLSYPPEG